MNDSGLVLKIIKMNWEGITLSIRIEETKDSELLARLNHDVQELHTKIEPTIFKPYSKEGMTKFFEELLSDEMIQAYIAYWDDSPAGYILLSRRHYPETYFRHSYSAIYIEQICVERNFKGKKIGQKLIAVAKDYARQMDINRIELDYWSKNKNAGKFFASQGFEPFNSRMNIQI